VAGTKVRPFALLLPLLLLAIGLAACGGGGAGKGKGEQANGAVQAVSEGERVYTNRCMACHGGELEGGFGPELRGIGGRMSREELIRIVTDGTGLMQPFRDRLTEEEIAAVVDWIRTQ